MNFILQIYKKLLTLFNTTKTKSDLSNLNNINSIISESSVVFGLHKDSSIVMFVNIPNVSELNPIAITSEAENYANFIVHITNGLIHDQILNLLSQQLKTSSDINKKLFIENILYFIPILEQELEVKLNSQIINNKPMISPLKVFHK